MSVSRFPQIVCRDCLGEPAADPGCWRCHGELLIATEDEAQADLVVVVTVDASGVRQRLIVTPRLRASLADDLRPRNDGT